MTGYTDSQSWEAWLDTLNVLWDNTELIFLASVVLSIGAVTFTWLKYPRTHFPKNPYYEQLNSPHCDLVETNKEDRYVNENVSHTENVESNFLDFTTPTDESSLHFSTKQLTQEIESQMSEEEKNKEIEARNQQLAAIFKLMKEQEDKFGDPSMEDIKKQMKFYCG